jgi:hypothetical protein
VNDFLTILGAWLVIAGAGVIVGVFVMAVMS